jgi:hypothetical protein
MAKGGTRSLTAQRSRASSRSARSTGSFTARAASRSPSRPTFVRPATVHVDKTYEHVLQLLGFDRTIYQDHPVIEALTHGCYTTFPSLFTLCQADVESLTYLDTDVQPPVRKPLPKGNQTRLLVPQGYGLNFQSAHHRAINPVDWFCTTVDVS